MESLLRDAIELAWRQWTALGVRGVAPIPEDAIDLEALIAFTPSIATAEPRLAAEARDWCARIGPDFISVSRLKQLQKLFPAIKTQQLARDAIDAALRRGRGIATTGKSRAPDLGRPTILALRARRVFGIGARADLIIALLRRRGRSDGVYASDFVALGYTKRTIALILDDLASAGVVESLPTRNSATYWLERDRPILDLLAPVPTRIPKWVERLGIVAAILDVTSRTTGKSRVSLAVELQRVFDHTAPLIRSLEMSAPTGRGPDQIVDTTMAWAAGLLSPS